MRYVFICCAVVVVVAASIMCIAFCVGRRGIFLYSHKAGALPIYINYCIKFGAKLQKVSFSLLRLPRR